MLEHLIYSKPAYTKSANPASFVGVHRADETLRILREITRKWIETTAQIDEVESISISLATLFDVLMSALYAQRINTGDGTMLSSPISHVSNGEDVAIFPYLWMCPVCIREGVEPASAYLPEGKRKGSKFYAIPEKLSRPNGRMIGDFGALVLRVIIEELIGTDARFTSGGGHRGEFDLVITTASSLILGEIKASPLVCFPVGVTLPDTHTHHEWLDQDRFNGEWFLYIGAAETSEDHQLKLDPPSSTLWPLPNILSIAADRRTVSSLLKTWNRHLHGYRLFNQESAGTRWLRFGCGNIETTMSQEGGSERVQLRVDNTKNLPGIDRTDDIKKGITQVILFGRLKKGCRARAIKTVLFGNLYAETHHEHYVKPLANLQMVWPGEEPVYLFDAIIALSRNLINDSMLQKLFDLPNEPYEVDTVDPAALVAELVAKDPDEEATS